MTPRMLIVETSGRAGQVALAEGVELVQLRNLDETRRHAADLAPAVADMLTTQSWKPRDLAAVIVSRGPGSYTGLRVGIMSAKTLAYAVGCKLLAIDTFAAIALQAPPGAAKVDVIADAQQDKIYVQRFERDAPARWSASSALAIQPFPEWLDHFSQCDHLDVWVSGPALSKLRDRLPTHCHVVDLEYWNPRAESLLRLGLERFQAGASDDIWSVEPLYLRPSSAEQNWPAKR